MNVLHLSAIPVWGQGVQSGMPSLHQCLLHYQKAGHSQTLVVPDTLMVDAGDLRVSSPLPATLRPDLPIEVVRASAPALRASLIVRSRLSSMVGFPLGRFALEHLGANLSWMSLTAGFIRTALNLARRKRFDVVYAHNDYTALCGWALGRMLGIANVTRLYGTFLGGMLDKRLLWLKYPVMCSAFKMPCSLLVVTNDGTRGDLVARRFGVRPERLRFWANGVDRPEAPGGASLPFDAAGPLLVTLQRHVEWKRIDRVIRALPAVRAQVSGVRLAICGTGPLTDRLRELAGQLGVADAVIWPGALDRNQVQALLVRAGALVSTNDLSNRGNPVIEALIAGCPVVTFDDGSADDILTDGYNSLLVPAGDVDALGRALVRVLTDRKLRDKLSSGARSTAERSIWSWSQRMDREIREVQQVVYNRPGRRPAGATAAGGPGGEQ